MRWRMPQPMPIRAGYFSWMCCLWPVPIRSTVRRSSNRLQRPLRPTVRLRLICSVIVLLCAGTSAALAADKAAIDAAITEVNQYRGEHGRGLVTLEARLDRAALRHARAMADQDFFSHTGADGSSMGKRLTQAGYIWSLVAENIAAGQQSPKEAIGTWMDSPGHRHNILMKGVIHIGLAHVSRDPDPGEVSFKDYWVMVLAAPIK